MNTSQLTGSALDWAVAKCENTGLGALTGEMLNLRIKQGICPPRYSTDWSLGGPIIEREGVEIKKGNPLYFPKGNENGDFYEALWLAGKQHGQTPLIAAMRCYVASKLGTEVNIPEELL